MTPINPREEEALKRLFDAVDRIYTAFFIPLDAEDNEAARTGPLSYGFYSRVLGDHVSAYDRLKGSLHYFIGYGPQFRRGPNGMDKILGTNLEAYREMGLFGPDDEIPEGFQEEQRDSARYRIEDSLHSRTEDTDESITEGRPQNSEASLSRLGTSLNEFILALQEVRGGLGIEDGALVDGCLEFARTQLPGLVDEICNAGAEWLEATDRDPHFERISFTPPQARAVTSQQEGPAPTIRDGLETEPPAPADSR